MNLFDARILVQMYAPRECSMAQRIFLEMKNVSKVEKARFVKEFREAYEQLIKRTDKKSVLYLLISVINGNFKGTS